MPETFHGFPRLPYELRLQIWSHALRPALPGAHFFRICPAKDNLPAVVTGSNLSICLVAPKCRPREGKATDLTSEADTVIPWNHHNPSAYLVDGGLWTACSESRRSMQENIHNRICSKISQPHPDDPREDSPSTGYFPAWDRLNYYFTVSLKQDLFIMQKGDEFARIRWTSYIALWPNTGNSATGEPKHIAYEYNPLWKIAPDRPDIWWDITSDIGRVTNMILHELFAPCFWFVDYALKRKHHVPTKVQASAQEKAHSFYGNSRRFVQVDYEQNDSMWYHDDEHADTISPCMRFAAAVVRLSQRRNSMFHGELSNEIGILACEYL